LSHALAVVSVLLVLVGGCSSTPPTIGPNDAGELDTIAVMQPDAASTDRGSDRGGDSGSVDAGDGGPSCDPSVTYATFGMAFFATYCGQCHLWDESSAQQSGYIISAAAGPGGFMPPSAPLPTDQERARLTAWIACGAP